jgi:hypothetical protein
MTSDQFNYVIIQASDCYFGFDLMDVVERGCIFALIHTKDTEGIIGWMVSKILPDWVGGYSDWLSYEKQVANDCSHNLNKFGQIPVSMKSSGHYKSDEDKGSSMSNSSNSDSDACFTDDDYVKNQKNVHVASRSFTKKKIILDSSDEDDQSDFESVIPTCDWACEGRCIPMLKPIKCQYSGGCKKFVHHTCTIEWASENNVDEGGISILCREHHPEFQHYLARSSKVKVDHSMKSGTRTAKNTVKESKSCDKKKGGEKKGVTQLAEESMMHQSNIRCVKSPADFDDNDQNMDIFKAKSFTESLTQNLKAGPLKKNPQTLDIYVSGPFRNENSGIVHWSVVYGNLSDAWMLKASFMSAYIRTILTSLQFKSEDICHTESYYDFNIRTVEFGEASKWKRTKKPGGKTGTVSRVSFVYSCKLSDEGVGLKRLRRILDKVMWAMKARIHNPIGPILFKHCEREEEGILNYLMEKNHNNEEATKEKITAAVDSTFKNGYNLKVHSSLNQFMVDYDIIRILKNNMGYSSWAEVSDTERAICFKNYSRNKILPDWNIEEETYNSY